MTSSSSKPPGSSLRSKRFSEVEVGQSVTLDDQYVLENHKLRQIQLIIEEKLAEGSEQAEAIVRQAQEQAQQLVAQAQEEAKRIVQEEGHNQRDGVLEEGYKEGYAVGLQRAMADMADRIQTVDIIVGKIFEAEKNVMSHYQADMIAVMTTLLKRIVHDELEASDKMATMIEQAAERIHESGQVKIIINAETYTRLQETSPQVLEALTTLKRIVFKPDVNCPAYEMYLETVDSCFDISANAQVETYMDAVADHVVLDDQFYQSQLEGMASVDQKEPLSEPSVDISPAVQVMPEVEGPMEEPSPPPLPEAIETPEEPALPEMTEPPAESQQQAEPFTFEDLSGSPPDVNGPPTSEDDPNHA